MILNMDDIRQQKFNECTILNFNENSHRQSLREIFGAHFGKSMVFKILKKSASFLEITFSAEKHMWGWQI